MSENKRLVLIDGHAMLYRAWFAFPQSLTTRDGQIINAVYGFTRILLNAIEELKPEYLAVSFDIGKTFRHEMFADYKAHREKMPEELKAQEPMVDRVLNALNIPIIAKEGYEADDVIGSLAVQAAAITKKQAPRNKQISISKNQDTNNLDTVIVTGDKDILQMVDNDKSIKVYMPARANKPAVIYDESGVMADLGVTADQIPDYKGLAGDSSDNIPGVRGVGPKTAVGLLKEFGTVENLYEKISGTRHEELVKTIREAMLVKLIEAKEMAFLSKKLATIIIDVPIELDLKACEVRSYDKAGVVELFKELEFSTLINKLPKDEFEEAVQEALF